MDVDDSGAVRARIIKVMRSRVLAFLIATGGFSLLLSGQAPAWFADVHANLTGFRYPPLAQQARITGNVSVRVTPLADGTRETTVVTGHPLLRPVVLDDLAKWRFETPIGQPITVDFLFRLTPIQTTTRRVPRGDSSLDRLFLRLFHMAKYRDIVESQCATSQQTVTEGPMVVGSFAVRVNVEVPEACVQTLESVKVTD